MTITSFDGLIGATKQQICYSKVVNRTPVGGPPWDSVFDLGGNPGAGTLAGTNAANGVVPTQGQTGFPVINAFGGGATGYLMAVTFGFGNSGQTARIQLSDCLFKAGTYAFNSGTTTLTSQPSYSARVDSAFTGTQIWIEVTSLVSGANTVTVTYTNGAGTTGRTCTAVNMNGFGTGAMKIAPLQSGDCSVSKIESVACSGGTSGVYNILVLRPIWSGGITQVNQRLTHGIGATGLPVIYQDTALYCMSNGNPSGYVDIDLTIANG